MSDRTWNTDIKDIGDKIVGLTLLQAKELADYLKEVHGIEPAAGGAVMMAGPAAVAAAPEEKTSFNVMLKSYPADKKIGVIKEVRGITSLGLKEAKDLVEAVPKIVKENAKKDEADAIKKQLEAAGAVVELQ
jgi:large subunit ribosomal protein L7/L12